MGLDPVSPVSPLNHLSFSSSGDDLEDVKLSANSNYDSYATIILATNSQKKLKISMQRASNLQHALEQSHSRTQGISARLPALKGVMTSLAFQENVKKELLQRIDSALQPSVSVLQLFDKVHRYEIRLSQGPKSDVGRYIHDMSMLKRLLIVLEKRCPIAMETLHETVRFLRSQSPPVDKFRLHKLHETSFALGSLQARQERVKSQEGLLEEASEHLETEFRRILTDCVRPLTIPSRIFLDNVGALDINLIPPTLLPSPVVQLLGIIVETLAAEGRLKNSFEIYEDVSSWKLSESFQSLSSSYLPYMKPKALDALQWANLEEHITMWNRHMYVVLEIFLKPERVLFDSIFSSIAMKSHECTKCFAQLAMKSGFSALLDFGESFTKSQKEPQKIFKLLDMFKTLGALYPSLEQVFIGDGCIDARRRIEDLQRNIVRGAWDVFCEFGIQVEMQREGTLPEDGGVLKPVRYVINYLKYLFSDMYRDSIAEVLQIEQYRRRGPMKEIELSNVILQIMEALLRNVEHRSHNVEEPALSCILRMNNYWYIYTRCESSNLGSLLGDAWLNEQKEKVEHVALQYLREAWSGVLSHLSMEGLKGASNIDRTREFFYSHIEAFEDALADMHLKHSRWWFSSSELRQQIGDAVLKLIVPAYRSYVFNCGQHVKCLKSQLTAEALEQMLITLFEEKPVPMVKMPNHANSSSDEHVNGQNKIGPMQLTCSLMSHHVKSSSHAHMNDEVLAKGEHSLKIC